eukprot:scaffold238_cov532-Prasinococcus_capsulatus_cf.AAC.5
MTRRPANLLPGLRSRSWRHAQPDRGVTDLEGSPAEGIWGGRFCKILSGDQWGDDNELPDSYLILHPACPPNETAAPGPPSPNPLNTALMTERTINLAYNYY